MIEKSLMENMGFKQIPGAPEGATFTGYLEYWPTYKDKHWPGHFELHRPKSGVPTIPKELQPGTGIELVLLNTLLESIAHRKGASE